MFSPIMKGEKVVKSNLSFEHKEVYSNLKVPEGLFFVRLDGWNFHSLSRKLGLVKPFDSFFAECMVETAKVFFWTFNPSLAFLFSDEINLLLSKSAVFNRRLEKIDSVFAGLASSSLYKFLSQRYRDLPEVSFDCRVIPMGESDVLKYLVWRQMEAYRNCYNAYAQHTLIRKNRRAKDVADELRNVKIKDLKRMIMKHGIRLSQIPDWHERGIIIHWETFEKDGYDPVKDEKVVAKRRRIVVEWSPPWFNTSEGAETMRKWLLASKCNK